MVPNLVWWDMKSGGSHDWDYPFDLCASIYRKDDIIVLLTHMAKIFGGPKKAYGHPNLLEANANRYHQSIKPTPTPFFFS